MQDRKSKDRSKPPGQAKPTQPYTYENGTPHVPPARPDEPFIPDRGFDGPA